MKVHDAVVKLSEQYKFTGRELEVLTLLAQGCDNTEVAEQLQIAYPTARNYIYQVHKKTGTIHRGQMLALVIRTMES